ncbi:MAG: aminotransferase class V-fold PLP-dependent enzyme [Spirochaetes bacterium]|nr:MAG: aminotransferase class V-fold PLP-dependent enzyme [Spirochaetota bacterium]
MIYLDNAATSWPKPPGVQPAMAGYMTDIGANPGRSGHRLSVDAARILFDTREKLARLFKGSDPSRVIFTMNATAALNLAMRGILREGDHVLTTGMEHNSVMRTLNDLRGRGVLYSILPTPPNGVCDADDLRNAVRKNTVMLIINHGSNVNGAVQGIAGFGKIARELGLCVLVDAAQTAGIIDIDLDRDCIDMLAFTGHKGLLGPQGTGGLVLGTGFDHHRIKPQITGGTGSLSEMEYQPDFLPDMCESGTPNTVGIAGLSAGLDYIFEAGLEEILTREMAAGALLREGLASIDGVTVFFGPGGKSHLSTCSFIIEGLGMGEVGLELDERFNVLCRVGLHCSPLAHKSLGTFPNGTIRFSPGIFTSREEITQAVGAVRQIAAHS